MNENKKVTKDFIQGFVHLAEHYCTGAQEFDEDSVRSLDTSIKTGLAEILQNVINSSQKALAALNISCPVCHKTGGKKLGSCPQCGREVCSLCGQIIEGNPVHASVCALYYKSG